MSDLSEKRKKRIVEQILKYATTPAGGRVKYYNRQAFTMSNPDSLVELIRFLYDKQGEIAVLIKWANLNKKAVHELTPEMMKEVQSILAIQEVHEE